jgi:hypothetical protein
MRKQTILTEDYEILLHALQLSAMSRRYEFRTTEAYSSLVPNSEKCNINQQSKVVLEKIIDLN